MEKQKSIYQYRYRKKHRERYLLYQRKWYNKNKDKRISTSKIYCNKTRMELIEILGGAKCVKCGFFDIRALQLEYFYQCSNL